MVDRIACFFTCGYTEAGAMQRFLKKMNPSYDFKQILPNKTRKKKGEPKVIKSEMSGLTGEALVNKICQICESESFRKDLFQYKALLIEDDLDGRFSCFSEEKINQYNQAVVGRVYESLGSREVPVFLIYASPEVESWFVADWENGFKKLYCDKGIIDDIDANVRTFFAHHLKQYLETEVLREYADDIEAFGWFDGQYVKLSDQIIKAVQTDVKIHIQSLPVSNEKYVDQILNSRKLYYSKNTHGDFMLRNIQPEIVEKKCRRYFREAYNEIKKI